MTIIGLAGRRGSGKDTTAGIIQELLEPSEHHDGPEHPVTFYGISFARPIKEFVQLVFDMSDEQVWGSEKEAPDRRYSRMTSMARMKEAERQVFQKFIARYHLPVSPHELEFFLTEREADGEYGPPFLTSRYAQQTLGTEWGRMSFDRVWVDLVRKQLQKLRETVPTFVAVVTDVRFPNEAEAVRAEGGVLWRVSRGKPSWYAHESEALVDTLEVDAEIDNNGTLEQLRERITPHLANAIQMDDAPTPVTRLGTGDFVQNPNPTD